MDLIRKKAQEFVESQMNTNSVQRSKTMVFVKNIPKVVVKPDESHLTPKEKEQLMPRKITTLPRVKFRVNFMLAAVSRDHQDRTFNKRWLIRMLTFTTKCSRAQERAPLSLVQQV